VLGFYLTGPFFLELRQVRPITKSKLLWIVVARQQEAKRRSCQPTDSIREMKEGWNNEKTRYKYHTAREIWQRSTDFRSMDISLTSHLEADTVSLYYHYGCPSAIASCRPFCFTAVIYFFFSPPNLRGPLADRHQTSPRSTVTQIYKIWSEIWEPLLLKFGGTKTWNFGTISDNFATWSWISLERNNNNCGLSRTEKLNSV